MADLWVLQTKDDEGYWVAVTRPVPLEEIERYLENAIPMYQRLNRQKFYRAYCETNDQLETLSWQALPDFPDFKQWVEVAKAAVMEDGSAWQKVH